MDYDLVVAQEKTKQEMLRTNKLIIKLKSKYLELLKNNIITNNEYNKMINNLYLSLNKIKIIPYQRQYNIK